MTQGNEWYSFIDEGEFAAELNPLAVLFRKICYDLGIRSVVQYEDLLVQYVETREPDPKARNGAKNNLKKSMLSPNMTIKGFMECMTLLQLDEYTLTLDVVKNNKQHSATDTKCYTVPEDRKLRKRRQRVR